MIDIISHIRRSNNIMGISINSELRVESSKVDEKKELPNGAFAYIIENDESVIVASDGVEESWFIRKSVRKKAGLPDEVPYEYAISMSDVDIA